MYQRALSTFLIAGILSLFSFKAVSMEKIKIPQAAFSMGCSLQDSTYDKDVGTAGEQTENWYAKGKLADGVYGSIGFRCVYDKQ